MTHAVVAQTSVVDTAALALGPVAAYLAAVVAAGFVPAEELLAAAAEKLLAAAAEELSAEQPVAELVQGRTPSQIADIEAASVRTLALASAAAAQAAPTSVAVDK